MSTKKKYFFTIFCARVGPGVGSRFASLEYGSEDPDLHQKVLVSNTMYDVAFKLVKIKALLKEALVI